MLVLDGLTKHFGGVRAVDGINVEVEQGKVFGLIGPNGSGKSTTVNLICGVFPATSGRIVFNGIDITRMPTHRRLSVGIARTFQNIRLFEDLTVWQNLWVAQNSEEDVRHGFFGRWLGGSRAGRSEVEALLASSGLHAKRNDLARNLAFGEQRRLEMARALAAKPKLLLLDEPAAGMSAEEIETLADWIRSLQAGGMTVLLVEHVMDLVMGVSDHIAVLNFGLKIADGSPEEIQDDQQVREAYLGTGRNAEEAAGAANQ
ncbi:MAG TPA: ABC transporter ATP-binding protein [Aestuariivirgaceae bacterium]|nr:ABC transporter ATP-binding protein [Aestuariivirgaceae bacterium]